MNQHSKFVYASKQKKGTICIIDQIIEFKLVTKYFQGVLTAQLSLTRLKMETIFHSIHELYL